MDTPGSLQILDMTSLSFTRQNWSETAQMQVPALTPHVTGSYALAWVKTACCVCET